MTPLNDWNRIARDLLKGSDMEASLKTEQREDGWYWMLDYPTYRNWHGPYKTQADATRSARSVYFPNA